MGSAACSENPARTMSLHTQIRPISGCQVSHHTGRKATSPNGSRGGSTQKCASWVCSSFRQPCAFNMYMQFHAKNVSLNETVLPEQSVRTGQHIQHPLKISGAMVGDSWPTSISTRSRGSSFMSNAGRNLTLWISKPEVLRLPNRPRGQKRPT